MKSIKKRLAAALTIVFALCLSLAVFAACAPTEDEMYEVTVNAGTHGSVTLTPEAKDGKYESDKEVTVKVTPDSGYVVDSFKVDVDSAAKLNSNNEYKFKVTADTKIDVTFKKQSGGETPSGETYTVTVNGATHGKVELSPAKTDNKYEKGTNVTVTVTPASGYKVGSFKVNGTETPLNGNTYVINDISANMTIDVTFVEEVVEKHSITVTCGTNGSYTLAIGSQTLTGAENVYTVNEGSNVTLTVTPASGYEVDEFTVSGDDSATLSAQNTYVIENVADDVDITISFVKRHSITVTCGDNGSYTLAIGDDALNGTADVYKVDDGSDVIFTAKPNSGYVVDAFTVSGDNGAELDGEGKYTINNVTADVTINVTFKVAPLEFADAYINNGNNGVWGKILGGGTVADAAANTIKFTSKTTVTVNNHPATIVSGNAQNGYVVNVDTLGERTIIVKCGVLVLVDKNSEYTSRAFYASKALGTTFEVPETLQNTTWTCTATNGGFTSTRQLEFKDNKATFGGQTVYNLTVDTDDSIWGYMNSEWLNIVIDEGGKNAIGNCADGTKYMTLVMQESEQTDPSVVFADSYVQGTWKNIAAMDGMASDTKTITFTDNKTVKLGTQSATLVSGSEKEGYTVAIDSVTHKLFLNDDVLVWLNNQSGAVSVYYNKSFSETLTVPAEFQNATLKGMIDGKEQSWKFTNNGASTEDWDTMLAYDKDNIWWCGYGTSAVWYKYVIESSEIKVYLASDNSLKGTLSKDGGGSAQPSGLKVDKTYEGTWSEVQAGGSLKAGNQIVLGADGVYTIDDKTLTVKSGDAQTGYTITFTEYSSEKEATILLKEGVLVYTQLGGYSTTLKVYAKEALTGTLNIPESLKNKTLHSTYASSQFMWGDKRIVFTADKGTFYGMDDLEHTVDILISIDSDKEFYIFTFGYLLLFQKQEDDTYKAMQGTTHHSTWEVQNGATEPERTKFDVSYVGTWSEVKFDGSLNTVNQAVINNDGTGTVLTGSVTIKSGDAQTGYVLDWVEYGSHTDVTLLLSDGGLIYTNSKTNVLKIFAKNTLSATIANLPEELKGKTLTAGNDDETSMAFRGKTIVFNNDSGKYNTSSNVYFFNKNGVEEFYISTFGTALHFVKQGDGSYKAMQGNKVHSNWTISGGSAAVEETFTVTNSFETANGTVTVEPNKEKYTKDDVITITLAPAEGYTIGEFKISVGGVETDELNGEERSLTSEDDGKTYIRSGLMVTGNIVITGKFVAKVTTPLETKFAADIKGKTWHFVTTDKDMKIEDTTNNISFTDDTNVKINGTTLTLTSVEKENVYVLSEGKLYYVPGVDALVYVKESNRFTYVTELKTTFNSFPTGLNNVALMKDGSEKLYFTNGQILLGGMESDGKAANFSGTADDFWLIVKGEVIHVVKNPEKQKDASGKWDVWEYKLTYADGTAYDTYTVDA